MERRIIRPEEMGLTKVEGVSFEDFVEFFEECGLKFNISSPSPKSQYFRDSYISVFTGDSESIGKFYDFARPYMFTNWTYHYFALYKIEPNFNWDILNGLISFKEGSLV